MTSVQSSKWLFSVSFWGRSLAAARFKWRLMQREGFSESSISCPGVPAHTGLCFSELKAPLEDRRPPFLRCEIHHNKMSVSQQWGLSRRQRHRSRSFNSLGKSRNIKENRKKRRGRQQPWKHASYPQVCHAEQDKQFSHVEEISTTG